MPLLLQRAADGVIAAENTVPNGLPRANRNAFEKMQSMGDGATTVTKVSVCQYVLRGRSFTSSRVAPQDNSCPGKCRDGLFCLYGNFFPRR